jgi:hypothetical protein
MIFRTAIAIALMTANPPAIGRAAEIEALTSSPQGTLLISIVGDLESGDEKKFINVALPASDAIVVFHSNGGDLQAGIEIGKAIRLKGFTTLVPSGVKCASACALAWLGGRVRAMSADAKIGFHAASFKGSGQVTSAGNALIGAYVNQLGLPTRAVLYITEVPPDEIRWMTISEAQEQGIDVNKQSEIPRLAETPGSRAPVQPPAAAPETPGKNPLLFPIPTVTVPTVPVRPNDAPQPPAATAPTISRAALLKETPGEPEKPKVVAGTATWTLFPALSGQAQTGGPSVQADIDIPDAKMRAPVTIRKNIDASLPATHTIALRFSFAAGADIKGFKDMALPQMRRDDTPRGDALSGVRVKINDAYFLVGLTRSDTDTAHNLELLSTRNWLDFPLLLNDDHLAKLTFEKGAKGQGVIAQAIEAWK